MNFFPIAHIFLKKRNRGQTYSKMLLIMRLTLVFLLAACLKVNAGSYAQSITLKVKNKPLTAVFSDIQKQSGFQFFFNQSLLKKSKPVTFSAQGISIDSVLSLCFRDQPLTYLIVENVVVVKDRENNLKGLSLKMKPCL